MDRQTLRDWVHRSNAEGLAGLSDRRPPGPTPRLTCAQQAEVAALVRQGPDLAEHGVVRWRRIDLARVIESRFGVVLAERSVGDLLRRLGFTRLSVRPRHPQADAAAQEAHKKLRCPDRGRRAGTGQDQADRDLVAGRGPGRPEGYSDPGLGREGQSPARPRDQRYTSAHLFGAVCPARAVGAAWVVPKANAWAMNLHLAEISRQVAPGAHAVVVLDSAGWHQSGGRLHVPDNISLLHLPPSSPELNPIENVWQYLRQNHLANRVYEGYDAIVTTCCEAWNGLMAAPDRIRSIASREWAQVKP